MYQTTIHQCMLHCFMETGNLSQEIQVGIQATIHQCMLHYFMETGNLSQEIQVGIGYNTSMHAALLYGDRKLITGDLGRYSLQYINACCITLWRQETYHMRSR